MLSGEYCISRDSYVKHHPLWLAAVNYCHLQVHGVVWPISSCNFAFVSPKVFSDGSCIGTGAEDKTIFTLDMWVLWMLNNVYLPIRLDSSKKCETAKVLEQIEPARDVEDEVKLRLGDVLSPELLTAWTSAGPNWYHGGWKKDTSPFDYNRAVAGFNTKDGVDCFCVTRCVKDHWLRLDGFLKFKREFENSLRFKRVFEKELAAGTKIHEDVSDAVMWAPKDGDLVWAYAVDSGLRSLMRYSMPAGKFHLCYGRKLIYPVVCDRVEPVQMDQYVRCTMDEVKREMANKYQVDEWLIVIGD